MALVLAKYRWGSDCAIVLFCLYYFVVSLINVGVCGGHRECVLATNHKPGRYNPAAA